jgi:hypothetical protein
LSLGPNPFENEDDSSERIDAIEVMDALREHSRPSWSPEIDRMMIDAANNGWTAQSLALALNKELGSNAGPGVTMMLLRRLTPLPPPRQRLRTGMEPQIIGHYPCNIPQHPDNCQLCYCDRNHPAQHVEVEPMPDWFKERFGSMFSRFGRIPDE